MKVTDQVHVPTVLVHGKGSEYRLHMILVAKLEALEHKKNILPNAENLAAF